MILRCLFRATLTNIRLLLTIVRIYKLYFVTYLFIYLFTYLLCYVLYVCVFSK